MVENIETRVRSRNCNSIIIFIYDIILKKLEKDSRLELNKNNHYLLVVNDMNKLFRIDGKFISYNFCYKDTFFYLSAEFKKDEDTNTYSKVDEDIYFKLKEKGDVKNG